MPRASIDYMNARRACKAASGGAKQIDDSQAAQDRRRVDELAGEDHADGFYIAMKAIGDFSLQAELSRQVLAARLGIPQTQSETEIPF